MDLTDPKQRAAALRQETEVLRIRHEAKRAVLAEQAPPRGPIRALTIRELYDRPQPTYLVDGFLPAGALAELIGDSESLKSFLAIDLGMSIAAHKHDFFGLRVVTGGPVLYIAAEGAGSFQFRLRAWGAANDVDVTTLPFFTIASPINLRDVGFQLELQAIVADVKPVLVIVDTLHRCIPGAEENSSRDLGEVVGFATQLQADSGAAVLFLHHPPKGDPAGRGRGSGALYYAADTEISSVVEGDENPDGTKVIVLSVKKQKDDVKTSMTLTNRIVPVLDELGRPLCHPSGRAITSCVLELASDEARAVATQGPEDRLADQVLGYLRIPPGRTRAEIRESVKASATRLNAALDGLESRQQVTRKDVKSGRAWRVEYSAAPVEEVPF